MYAEFFVCVDTFNVLHGSSKNTLDSVRPVGSAPDYGVIRSWLDKCDKEHKQCCADKNTAKLRLITLIDVRNRSLVRYKAGMQYVALSYVWGGVASPKRSRPFEFPHGVSTTIEHAMVVANRIGVPFLWADAVCINQHDKKEKEEQLPLMDYIYEQAFVTIVALGRHANIGLPGVEGGPKRSPQLVVEFGPVRLLSRCPTLESQIESSVWSSRGWTYQEGVFSRRCIFFSQHQVYFHCNSMLCTEDSPTSTLLYPEKGTKNPAQGSGYWASDTTYIKRNSLWRKEGSGNIQTYITYLGQYISRDVSYDLDAINAFSALLARLQRDFFFRGFIHGIPRDDFRNGLLWAVGGKVSPREAGGFPSWSWAAWKVSGFGTTYGLVSTTEEAHRFTVPHPLQISLRNDLLHDSRASNMRLSGISLELQNLWNMYSKSQRPVPAGKVTTAPSMNALYIDGPIVSLPVTYDPTTQVIGFMAPRSLPRVKMIHLWPSLDEKCRRGWQQLPIPGGFAKTCEFLVLQTTYSQSVPASRITFTLMLLKQISNNVRVRAGVLHLSIENDLAQFWEFAAVRRDVFWLV